MKLLTAAQRAKLIDNGRRQAAVKGKPQGSPVLDYVVEDHADHILKICSKQTEAIE
jgi:hypothetical protein